MQKLLYLAPHLSTGGLPQYLYKQIELLQNNFDIYCIEWSNITGGVLVVQRNRIQNLLGNKLITLGDDKTELFNHIDRLKPDVIHLQEIPEIFTLPYNIASRLYSTDRRYTLIETSHDSSFDVSKKLFFPDRFLMVSQYQVEEYKKLNIPCDLVEYPIEYKKRTKSREEAIAVLGLDPTKKHVVNVGLFTPRKNQAEVIEYARKLKDYPIQFHFLGNQADNFKWYWEPLMKDFPPNCKWWNERSDVDAFYEAADLFLFTSRGSNTDKETMPLVIREAISWNTKSLIYNLPVYLNYFDKYDNIDYLNFDNLDINLDKILKALDMDINKDVINVLYTHHDNKIELQNKTDNDLKYTVIVKDYLSNHTIYWFDAHIAPRGLYWTIPCPKEYFFSKVANNNNFKGYKIDFLDQNSKTLLFTKEVIIDEHATNFEPTLTQNPYNCSYINYVEFFVKKYFDDYNIKDFDTFVDLGANDGLVSEWALNRGAKKIYCVEPDKRAVEYLKEKFINNLDVVIVDKAIYDKNEYNVKFLTNTDSSTITSLDSLVKDHTPPNQGFFLSETITFTRFLSDYKIDDISLLKIDIEGAEYDLLKSMTEEEKNKVKYYLIECHWLNQEKIKTILDVFNSEEYILEFRDHLNENVLVDVNDLHTKEMVTLFVTNKNQVKDTTPSEPKIVINHLLSEPDSEREAKSIASISKLEKHAVYNKVINKPYNDVPPQDTCHRPLDLADFPGGNNLTSRHYGCYKAHTDAIISCTPENNTIYLFFEGDAVLDTDPDLFIQKVKEAYTISKKYGYYFFSFGPITSTDRTYHDHTASTKLIEAHAYIIPGEKIKEVQEWVETLKWDVFDLWVSDVCPKQRIGYYTKPLSLQAKGVSLIDKQMSEQNHLGINKL